MTADNAVIFLPGEDQELSPSAVKRRKESPDEVVVSDTVLKRVVETRSAVLTADAILDSRFSSSESIVAQGIRSAMAFRRVNAPYRATPKSAADTSR